MRAPAAGKDKGGPGRIRERNRQRLLEAAEIEFAERGFDGATTAAIAARAGLPKANLHYYFPTKEAVYRELIGGILERWLAALDPIAESDDPAPSLARYIRRKMDQAREHPHASRVFAQEVIRGAPVIGDFLAGDLRDWVEMRGRVLAAWARQGRMDPIDPAHFFFAVWAATQTYADFAVQIDAVLGGEQRREASFEQAKEQLVRIFLKGCGIALPEAGAPFRSRREDANGQVASGSSSTGGSS